MCVYPILVSCCISWAYTSLSSVTGWFSAFKTIQLCLQSLVTKVNGEAIYAVSHSVLHSQYYFWRATEDGGLPGLSCSRIQLFPGKPGSLVSLSGSENSGSLPLGCVLEGGGTLLLSPPALPAQAAPVHCFPWAASTRQRCGWWRGANNSAWMFAITICLDVLVLPLSACTVDVPVVM